MDDKKYSFQFLFLVNNLRRFNNFSINLPHFVANITKVAEGIFFHKLAIRHCTGTCFTNFGGILTKALITNGNNGLMIHCTFSYLLKITYSSTYNRV